MRSLGNGVQSFLDNQFGHVVLGAIEGGGAAAIPTTASTYEAGCGIIDKSTSIVYQNVGTFAAPVWARNGSSTTTDPQIVQMVEISLTPAQLIATTTGAMSDTTNGLTVVPAAPAGFVNIFHRMIVSYTYNTAAYTGGGNTTVNQGGGGAALSGLIATGSLWQSTSNVIYCFYPLSTVATPMATATGISLKTASAITNPGTAAGTAKVYCWYSQVAI